MHTLILQIMQVMMKKYDFRQKWTKLFDVLHGGNWTSIILSAEITYFQKNNF